MKIRKTFLISRLVSFNKEQNESSVIDIECAQTDDHIRVTTLEEANDWMKKAGEQGDSVQVREAS